MERKKVNSSVIKDMVIYKIINQINNKIYIGRTSAKNPLRRWTEHKSKARKGPRTPIEYAIKKYGNKNFSFIIIDENVTNLNCAEKESFYIKEYKCISPNGYNLELYQPFFERSPKSKRKSSKHQQLTRRNSNKKYIGVFKSRQKRYYSEICCMGKKYTKTFNSEIKAAIMYDKLALFLFGNRALINFEIKRNKWIQNKFLFKKTINSLYKFVPEYERNIYFCKKRLSWRVRLTLNKKTIYLGQFKTLKEAISYKKQYLNQYGK